MSPARPRVKDDPAAAAPAGGRPRRRDGKVLSVPDGRTTGAAKGESLADIGQMFNGYGDVVIMRHTETESIEEIQLSLTIPLVNAGSGSPARPGTWATAATRCATSTSATSVSPSVRW